MERGVYIHFPFCATRCGYCDFYSTVLQVPHGRYAEAVLRELELRVGELEGRLTSIYVGGGTPSLWDADELGRVLRWIAAVHGVCLGQIEVTLEINPGTVDARGLDRLVAAGINRASVGVQSMDGDLLGLLGRRHDVQDSVRTVRRARAAGFASVSCDLICGVPGQSLPRHLDGLSRLLELEPDHLSLYSLTLSETSPLGRRGLRPVGQDLAAEMLRQGRELLGAAGLAQYEVSNYARPGHSCRHNCAIWAGMPYLGLGAGACSLAWDGRSNVRRANPKLDRYLAGAGPAVERVEPRAARFEALFLGLRTRAGIDRAAYVARFGLDPVAELGQQLEPLLASGFVSVDPERIRPTEEGIWFADELALRAQGEVENRPAPRGDPKS